MSPSLISSKMRRLAAGVLAVIAIVVVLAMICCRTRLDPSVKGSYSRYFSLTLDLERAVSPAKAVLVVMLKNISRHDFTIRVDPKSYHGFVTIYSKDAESFKVFQKDFAVTYGTAIWEDPPFGLKSGQTITWKIPLNELTTLSGQPVDWSRYEDNLAVATLNTAGVIIPGRGDRSDNAAQASPAIRLHIRATGVEK